MINETRTEAGASDLPRIVSLAVHELRTPVTVVAGYLRMLLREQGGPLTDKQRKMLDEADKSCARLGTMVAEMSELGKLEANELNMSKLEFDLAAAVVEAAGSVEDSERGVSCAARGGDQPLMVVGDETRVVMAIKALLHSAIRERAQPGVVIAECTAIDRWAVVVIGDEALLPALKRDAAAPPRGFDEWQGGMGLALPVARRVLEAHGGELWSAEAGTSRTASGLRLPLAG